MFRRNRVEDEMVGALQDLRKLMHMLTQFGLMYMMQGGGKGSPWEDLIRGVIDVASDKSKKDSGNSEGG